MRTGAGANARLRAAKASGSPATAPSSAGGRVGSRQAIDADVPLARPCATDHVAVVGLDDGDPGPRAASSVLDGRQRSRRPAGTGAAAAGW